MTVSSTILRIQYTADGSTGPYAYNFKIDNATDLVVTETDTTTGAETVKVLTTDYTVSGVGDPSGGNVTFVSGQQPTNSKRLTIERVVPLTQGLDLQTAGDLPSDSVEKSLDKLTFAAQQIDDKYNRAVKVPGTSSVSTLTLPDPSILANRGLYLRVKADGTGYELVAINAGQEPTFLTTKGDLLSHSGSAPGRLPVGSNNQLLVPDSAQGLGLKWLSFSGLLDAILTSTPGNLLVRAASAWQALALTTKGDLITRDASVMVRKAVGSDGQGLFADSNTSDGLRWRTGTLSQTFRGLYLRSHPDNDQASSKVMLVHADEIVMDDGEPVLDWNALTADFNASGAGGIDTGSKVASTLWEVFAIRKRADGAKALVLHRSKETFLDIDFNVGEDGQHLLRDASQRTRLGQGFKVLTAGPLVAVALKIAKVGTPTGNIWVTIESDNAGVPSGSTLATSRKLNVAGLPTTAQYVWFIFDVRATLATSTQYHITFNGDYTISAVNHVAWRADTTVAGYANGAKESFDGSAWTTDSDDDFIFQAYVERNNSVVTMPSTYNQKALIGYAALDGSSNVRGFVQLNNHVSFAPLMIQILDEALSASDIVNAGSVMPVGLILADIIATGAGAAIVQWSFSLLGDVGLTRGGTTPFPRGLESGVGNEQPGESIIVPFEHQRARYDTDTSGGDLHLAGYTW